MTTTRRRFFAVAITAAVILACLLPTDTPDVAHADEPVPPADHLTARLDDQENGWGQIAWVDDAGNVYDLGPTVKLPAPTTVRVAGASTWWDVPSLIAATAARWGLDAQQMLRIAFCESRYDPAAYNRSSGASGLFQAIPSTWRSTPQGRAGLSPFDPVANVEAAAWLMKTYGPGQWVCK